MNSSDSDNFELAAAVEAVTSPLSSSTTAASGSVPSSVSPLTPEELQDAKSRYLIIGRKRYLVPLTPEVEPGDDCIVVETRKGDKPIRCGSWTPPCPPLHHPETRENKRRFELWRRHRRWSGLNEVELIAKFIRNDLEDCIVMVADGGSWSPLLPDDPDVLAPIGIDLLPESRRPEFAARAADLGVNIDLFFRADDDLGDWNDPVNAAQELTAVLQGRAKRKPAPTSSWKKPIPRTPTMAEIQNWTQPGSGDSSDHPPRGGRSI